MYLQKVKTKKSLKKKLFSVGILKATDEKSRIRIRIRKSVVRIRSKMLPKCNGFTTLVKTVLVLPETLDDGSDCTAQPLCLDVSIDVPGPYVLRVVQREPRHVVQVCTQQKQNECRLCHELGKMFSCIIPDPDILKIPAWPDSKSSLDPDPLVKLNYKKY